MIWSRLKNYECPKCKRVLQKDAENSVIECLKCGFRITEERFNEIVNDMYKPRASDSYGAPPAPISLIDDFTSGKEDKLDEHDEFWLDPAATE